MVHHAVRQPIRFLTLAAALGTLFGVTSCKTVNDVWHYEAAERIASAAHMLKRQIPADPFSITVYQKIHNEGGPADIYFAGDGPLMNVSPDDKTVDKNPTPAYPLALHLAAFDSADNVVFVARPCQYSGMLGDRPGTMCKKDYWSKGRYSIESMNAMNTVLNKLKARYRLSGFNLIGYDGGAAVAVLMAAKRHDVLSIRTVGGNLDIDKNAADHHLPPPEGSLNPKDFAKDVATIPQIHFLGQWDRTIAPDVYQSFRDAMGPSTCIRYSLIADVDHENGWANRWPSLLAQPLTCGVTKK